MLFDFDFCSSPEDCCFQTKCNQNMLLARGFNHYLDLMNKSL